VSAVLAPSASSGGGEREGGPRRNVAPPSRGAAVSCPPVAPFCGLVAESVRPLDPVLTLHATCEGGVSLEAQWVNIP
jgi:hypothetical protein